MVIPSAVFLYIGPVLNQIEFDAIDWQLSKARNYIFLSWLYQHHRCALCCIKLPISEMLQKEVQAVLGCLGVSQPHVWGHPKTGEMRGPGKSQTWDRLAAS